MAILEDESHNVQLYTDDSLAKVVTGTDTGAKHALDVNIAGSDLNPVSGKFINVYLRDGTSREMNVNGSVTPVEFEATPPTGKTWYISRMILYMEDNSMNWQKFGGLSALTNGCDLEYDFGGATLDLLDGHTWIKNSDLIQACYDAEINSASSDILRMRWTFSKSGTFIQLNNTDSDRFFLTVNDNLTGIADFHVIIQGYEVDE